MLERLKELAKFEFISVNRGNPDHYKFGWKNGHHFYIDDHHYSDEYEGQYILIVWLDKQMKFNQDFREIEPLIEKLKEILHEN